MSWTLFAILLFLLLLLLDLFLHYIYNSLNAFKVKLVALACSLLV